VSYFLLLFSCIPLFPLFNFLSFGSITFFLSAPVPLFLFLSYVSAATGSSVLLLYLVLFFCARATNLLYTSLFALFYNIIFCLLYAPFIRIPLNHCSTVYCVPLFSFLFYFCFLLSLRMFYATIFCPVHLSLPHEPRPIVFLQSICSTPSFSVSLPLFSVLLHISMLIPLVSVRESSKQTKINFGSNRNKPKQDLFRVCFGLFRETKKKIFLVCFGVSNLYLNN
jgi:hypothetical protein